MCIQTRVMWPASVMAIIAATGSVLANRTVTEPNVIPSARLWTAKRTVSHIDCAASTSTETLYATCTRLRFLLSVQNVCTKVETAATRSASGRLSSITAIRINGRFTAIELVIRGNDT